MTENSIYSISSLGKEDVLGSFLHALPWKIIQRYLNTSSNRELSNYQCHPFYEQYEKLMKNLVAAKSYYLNFLHIDPSFTLWMTDINIILLSAKISNIKKQL